jgi:hypothetical protein
MARDPRFRPFRIALWVVYLTIVGVAIGLTVRSVVKSLRGPPRPSVTVPTRAAVRVCLTELDGLNKEQNEHAWKLGSDLAEGADAVRRWQAWSHEWEQRLDDLSSRCRLDTDDQAAGPGAFPGKPELGAARDAVLRVHRGYTLQVNRFAQEQAGLAREAAETLQAAREAVSQGAAAR